MCRGGQEKHGIPMLTSDRIKVLSWNVRGLGTRQSDLKTEILKQDPHILVMQETRRWVTNDKDLKWKGASVFNIPPRQLTRGNTSGLAIVVNPKVRYQLITCRNPEARKFDNPDETVDPINRQQESWDNS